MLKNIAILGSTGSIGTQTIEVVRSNPDRFRITGLTAGKNYALLIKQARALHPEKVAIRDESFYNQVKEGLHDLDIEILAGLEGLLEVATDPSSRMVVVALVGFAGLYPTIMAIGAGKEIALANKETIVVAGELTVKKAAEKKVPVLPIDSEHSAIFQCLMGEDPASIEKIILTASGGPFLHHSSEKLNRVTPEEALKHPNWKMGNKITVDSASLMNKGFEVIEARWLFNMDPQHIDVVIHPQSIIHSMVQFRDGSIKAQLGMPDMRMPIQLALSYPERIRSSWERFDFSKPAELTFFPANQKKFRNLALSYFAIEKGGNMPCILNAANEIAVEAFLKKRLKFSHIPDVIEKTMERVGFLYEPSFEELTETDREARKVAEKLILKKWLY
ncbi:MAG TPA: 1-deoxy-D-xylulose-5-phosphate reductoisomerase [Bacteroidetes bacterium]|nr:1-deoxy-D-xylulose-5-phosphate reductoisomerase [Bacteroidota bacterium]